MTLSLEKAYSTVTDYRAGERDLIFERLNYFLVATAFLATAYAALVAEVWNHPSTTIIYLAWLINGVGFYLSIFFAVINSLNSKILMRLDNYIRSLETGSIDVFEPFTYIHDKVIQQVFDVDFNGNALCFIAGPFSGLFEFIKNPFNNHDPFITYFVPLGFAGFWVGAFFWVLHGHILLNVFYFLPMIILIAWAWCLSKKIFGEKMNKMSLGMNLRELEASFEVQYKQQIEKQKVAEKLLYKGTPEVEQEGKKMNDMTYKATIQALLVTISENNSQIEKQLKRKS